MSWDKWHHDPREGEHPDPQDCCVHGVDRNEAGCGVCLRDELQPPFTTRTLTDAECAEAFAAFFRQKLDQIQQTEDERMGAHFAARFERT